MTLFRSLTNRIFFATALLAVLSIGAAVYNVNVAVTSKEEQELLRGLDEAGTLVQEYRQLTFDHFIREARLIADLPRFKAAVSENHAPTVRPVAEEYQQQLVGAHLFVVTGPTGAVLAEIAAEPSEALPPDALPGIRAAAAGREALSLWPHTGGILEVVSVPIWIDPQQPLILGTLSIGFSLDNRAAGRFRGLTNSEIAFGVDGAIYASTLPESLWPSFAPLLGRQGLTEKIMIGGSEYAATTAVLSTTGQLAGPQRTSAASAETGQPRAMAIILRSRTERLKFLNALHRTLAVMALVAVLAATLLSYFIARTVTRPLGAITATMREMAATGDLTRRIAVPRGSRWEDEDAQLVATTFNSLTDSIARFQREATQRERLSSLGRLSTVVAHEIRNPLMIIKTALRSLRHDDARPEQVRTAVADIDEEIARLNRIVTEVLDFAKPIRFDLAPADLNALCEDAVRATATDVAALPVRLDLDALPPVVTDAERLRLALVNILTNARHAVAARGGAAPPPDAIRLSTFQIPERRVTILVQDRGVGIPAEDLARVFEPFFTTRRTGTGLGLAITRNIIEGLGGTLVVSSEAGSGTQVRIELPMRET